MVKLRLSQQQLNLFSQCPRKFQQIYLDQLTSPLSVAEEERVAWGDRFHRLMQQRELCLPIDPLVAEDPQLQQCFNQFLATATNLFTPATDSFRVAEHQRVLKFNQTLLVAVYDLLIATSQQAQIFDWKTYRHPRDKYQLAQNWQTRLYPYILVETSDYCPEQVSMTYWFIQSQENTLPQSLVFPYTTQQHQQTHQDLTQLLDNLYANLNAYQQGQPFPKVSLESGSCSDCTFALHCQRIPQPAEITASVSSQNLTDLDNIQEIPI